MKKNIWWILVCGGVVIAAIIVVLLFERHDDFDLIREEGVFVQHYSDSKVKITVVTEDDLSLSAQVSSQIGSGRFSKGSGGFCKISFIPEQWAVEFQRPFELWVFDGISFHVFEKTAKGYKAGKASAKPKKAK